MPVKSACDQQKKPGALRDPNSAYTVALTRGHATSDCRERKPVALYLTQLALEQIAITVTTRALDLH